MLPKLPLMEEQEIVPKNFLQIWVGTPPPDHIWLAHRRWQNALEGWNTWLWQEHEAQGFTQKLMDACRPLGMHPRGIADIFRVALTYLRGGVYVDLDFLPVRDVDSLAGGPGFVVTTPGENNDHVLRNSVFGFPAGSRFLREVYAHAESALVREIRNEHFVAGPRAFAAALKKAPVHVEQSLEVKSTAAEQRAALTELDLFKFQTTEIAGRIRGIEFPQTHYTPLDVVFS